MKKRYLCPRHKEKTPSVVAYSDHAWCFGCNQQIPFEELHLEKADLESNIQYVEDLQSSIESIQRLPVHSLRGFKLHCSDRGYFLLWPDNSYYKFRSSSDNTPGGKYRGPVGHRKPWFKGPLVSESTLVLVEGEFNALTLISMGLPITVYSPGGAGDFYSKMAQGELKEVAKFNTVHIITDKDTAGTKAAIETKIILLTNGCTNVIIHLMEKDLNDVYTEMGAEALQEAVKRMGLPTRV